MLKTIKNQKTLFVFIKLILFAAVLYLLFYQIQRIDKNQWKEFQLKNAVSIVAAVMLVIPNIGLAYVKWALTVKVIGISPSRQRSIQSFFAGVVTGMLTPNMLGNFIGRFYYFERKHRIQIILFTMLSNFAQFIASITFGWVSLLIVGGFLAFEAESRIMIWIGVLMIASFLIYFFIEVLILRFRKKNYAQDFKKVLNRNKTYRLKLLCLSIFRFVIFTSQFSLLLHAFGEEINLVLIAGIWQVYLITMLAPSLFLGKLGIKESIALFVLGAIGVNEFSILFSSLLIWVINSFFPAIMGVFICKNKLV